MIFLKENPSTYFCVRFSEWVEGEGEEGEGKLEGKGEEEEELRRCMQQCFVELTQTHSTCFGQPDQPNQGISILTHTGISI